MKIEKRGIILQFDENTLTYSMERDHQTGKRKHSKSGNLLRRKAGWNRRIREGRRAPRVQLPPASTRNRSEIF